MHPNGPNDRDCIEVDLLYAEDNDFPMATVEKMDFGTGTAEKASLVVVPTVLFVLQEVVDRREGLLVSRVPPEDGQNYILVGSIDVTLGTETS